MAYLFVQGLPTGFQVYEDWHEVLDAIDAANAEDGDTHFIELRTREGNKMKVDGLSILAVLDD